VLLPARPAAAATAAETCLRIAAAPPKYAEMAPDAYQRAAEAWAAHCRQAMAGDDDPRLKVALAHALRADQRREQVALLRAAAAQGDVDASFLLWDSFRSWDQRLDRPPLISRDEAVAALKRAAAAQHPEAMFRLALLLDRGGMVKRDPAAARDWAQQALAHPPNDVDRDVIAVLAARLLAVSDRGDDRASGLGQLEELGRRGVFGAKAALAVAVRRDDPVRARALLEQALAADPGGAAPRLARMLADGEGGAPDPKRAWALVSGRNDLAAVAGQRGRFYLDDRLVARDVAKAIPLLRQAGEWDYAARLQVVELLAAHPAIEVERPQQLAYHAIEAAELGEPGALPALIRLKLSQHPQFRDKAGACKLIAIAAARSEPIDSELAADCRTD